MIFHSLVCVYNLNTAYLLFVLQRPEVVEDFVCNFLATNGLVTTLGAFQTEWYQLAKTDQLQDHLKSQTLPDAYAQ